MDKELYEYINRVYFNQKSFPIFEDYLKPKLIDVSYGNAVVKMQIEEEHLNLHRIIHGGVLTTLADLTMGVSCISLGKNVVTTEMSVSFIRAASSGQMITAKAVVDNDGNNLIRTSCFIYDQNGKLLLKAIGTFFVLGKLEF